MGEEEREVLSFTPHMKLAGIGPESRFRLKSMRDSFVPKQPGIGPVRLLAERSSTTSFVSLHKDFGMVPESWGLAKMRREVRFVSLAMDGGILPMRLASESSESSVTVRRL